MRPNRAYYMRAERYNWQQSERIMVGNLMDITTAQDLLKQNLFAITYARWNGDLERQYKPVLRLDSDNFHNANLCVKSNDWFDSGNSKACQSRLFEMFIVFTILASIAMIAISITVCTTF